MLGTPGYMAPEQLRGEPGGPASDIYALGVVLFEMVTGQLPFPGGTGLEDAKRHEVIEKAERRFAKADKQRASIKADPKEAVRRAKERVGRHKSMRGG